METKLVKDFKIYSFEVSAKNLSKIMALIIESKFKPNSYWIKTNNKEMIQLKVEGENE